MESKPYMKSLFSDYGGGSFQFLNEIMHPKKMNLKCSWDEMIKLYVKDAY
jgi:hypothetical protein